MDQHLNAFIEAHPEGWDHLAWELRRREVPGLGPRRIDAVVERFGTLWSLQHADVEDFAEIKKSVPGKLAEKVVAAVR